jgi:hypothetical protein
MQKCGPLPDQVCWRCKGTGSADSGGVTPSGESIEVPCECLSSETADEQETIFDRDVRAIVVALLARSNPMFDKFSSVVDFVNNAEDLASEMERQRKERKGIE